jgi:hypothetical protein
VTVALFVATRQHLPVHLSGTLGGIASIFIYSSAHCLSNQSTGSPSHKASLRRRRRRRHRANRHRTISHPSQHRSHPFRRLQSTDRITHSRPHPSTIRDQLDCATTPAPRCPTPPETVRPAFAFAPLNTPCPSRPQLGAEAQAHIGLSHRSIDSTRNDL